MNNKILFVISAIGIFVCFFIYGILHEKITKGRYGDELNEDGTKGERFIFAVSLVGIQCVFNCIFAGVILLVCTHKNDETHHGFYACIAITSLSAVVFTNMALRWVDYPTQVVAKSAKPVPVMVLSALLSRKSYTKQRYLFVLIIVSGIFMFMYKGAKENENLDNLRLGEFLLFLSLFMNGLSGAVQERMRAASAPSGEQMMFSINAWSSVILVAVLFITGEAFTFAQFANRHPEVLLQLTVLSLVCAFGQIFIFTMISQFGSLPCSIVSTSRKFFTVLCSVLVLGNNLSLRQWIATVVVFGGLFADVLFGRKPKQLSKESIATIESVVSIEAASEKPLPTKKIENY